jgi:hypothetical protein
VASVSEYQGKHAAAPLPLEPIDAQTKEELVALLLEHNLSPMPQINVLHTYQCAYPAVYGRCYCFEDLVVALLEFFDGRNLDTRPSRRHAA